jgi:GNAT superfamily N-acetyltransferase
MPDAVLESLSHKRDERKQKDALKHPRPGSKTFVAEILPAGIVGFAAGGYPWDVHPVYEGELFVIYILEMYQRLGLGRALVHLVKDHLKSLGLKNMIVWVLEENPARAFYEKLGGVVVDEKMMKRRGKQLKELAYGWPDIETVGESRD